MKSLFIIPHFSPGAEFALVDLQEAIYSVFTQSQSDWFFPIVDDLSSDNTSIEYLKSTQNMYPEAISVIFNLNYPFEQL